LLLAWCFEITFPISVEVFAQRICYKQGLAALPWAVGALSSADPLIR
jgi:hypothetical protein